MDMFLSLLPQDDQAAIRTWLVERDRHRDAGNFADADRIRDLVTKAWPVKVEDTRTGPRVFIDYTRWRP
jgi:cysteinyl-tRNA synthetase